MLRTFGIFKCQKCYMRAKQSLDHCCLFLYFYISKSTTIHPTKLALFGMRLNIIVQNKFKFQKQACMPQLPHVPVLPTSLLVAKYKALVIRSRSASTPHNNGTPQACLKCFHSRV